MLGRCSLTQAFTSAILTRSKLAFTSFGVVGRKRWGTLCPSTDLRMIRAIDGLGGLKARHILCRWREPPVLGNQDNLRPGGPTHSIPEIPGIVFDLVQGKASKLPGRAGQVGKHLFSETVRQPRRPILGAEDNVVERLLMGAHLEATLECVGPAGLCHHGGFGTGASWPRQEVISALRA